MTDVVNKVLFGANLIKNKAMRRRSPMYVSYLVNHRCNMRCAYCYGTFYDKEEYVLSTDETFKMIKDLAALGMRRFCLIGGEPLLRKDIKDVVLFTRKNNVECVLNTNGLLVEDNIEWLKSLNHLYVSFDGDKAGHESNRGKNTFEKVLSGIKLASKHKIPLGIVTVLTKNNLNSIDYLIELSREYKFNLNFFNLIAQENNNVRRIVDIIPSNDEYKKAFSRIKKAKTEGADVTYSMKAIDFTLGWDDYSKERVVGAEPGFKYPKCYAGTYYCVIDSNGDMFPCPMLMDRTKGPVPNVIKDTVKGAWDRTVNKDCHTCCFTCYLDMNLFFGLNLETIFQHVKEKIKE